MANKSKVEKLNIIHKNVKIKAFENNKNILDAENKNVLNDDYVVGTPTGLQFKQKQLHVKKNIVEGNTCPVCNKIFGFRKDLFKHIHQFHRLSKSIKCRQCRGTLFRSIRSFIHHIKTQHEVLFKKYHHCKFCSQTFNSKFRLSRHLMVHTGEQVPSSTFLEKNYKHKDSEKRPYACSICEKRYILRHNLRVHELKHCFKYVCKICCKSFERKMNLMSHFKIHSTERPFSCSICKKNFNLKYSLKQHQILHLQKSSNSSNIGLKRLFSCSFCEKTYNHKRNLSVHQKIHLTEKLPYYCSMCEKSYKYKGNLNQHQKSHNANTDNKKTLTVLEKELHVKNILYHSHQYSSNTSLSNTVKYDCKLCCKTFKTSKGFKRHSFSHMSEGPYTCSMCNKTFKNNNKFCRHISRHLTVKSYSCSLCAKTFKDRQEEKKHQTTHMTERPYSCSLCAKTFKDRYSEIRHQKTHLNNKPKTCYTDLVNKNKCDLIKKQTKTHLINTDFERKKPNTSLDMECLVIYPPVEDIRVIETNTKRRSSISYETMNDCIENEQENPIILNEIANIKDEIYSDNDSRDHMEIIDICKTEFIYDHAIVNAAKRIEENHNSTNLTNEDSFNTTDSIVKLNKNNIITKLKLRYKLLRGKCTLCNKVYECQDNFLKHCLKLHPNPEAFRSTNAK